MAAHRSGVARPVRTTEYTMGVVVHSGREWVRRQHELKRGARIWFTVDEAARVVQVIAVHTHHPNQTK